MKQFREALRRRIESLIRSVREKGILNKSNSIELDLSKDEELLENQAVKIEKQPEQIQQKGLFKQIVQKLFLAYKRIAEFSLPVEQASLFADGKTNTVASSLVLCGVAEVLSQKMDLPWKTEESGTLSYEKKVLCGKGRICYYVTDNPENSFLEILNQEAARAVVDQFDPRACAIHLIYCAEVASLDKPWEENFIIDDKQLLEYTGLVKRRDLNRNEQLLILSNLLRQPAQIAARIVWPKQGKVKAFTVADLQIWDIAVLQNFETAQDGNVKLTGLKVIGRPGVWARYFLNNSEYYRQTGVITKKTVQKLFSIGKQNAGAARLLIWLTFQIQPQSRSSLSGQALMEIAYGVDRVARTQEDRQLRRQLADDLETDLKVIQEAGWQAELETGPDWLTSHDSTKRPTGYWNGLLNARWRFNLPKEALDRLNSPKSRLRAINLQKTSFQSPPGGVIREARIAKGWSRAFLAATMGKSVSWVVVVETGHRKVSQKDLPKLINKLGLHKY